MVKEYQEHGGAVSTSTSPKVQYGYSEMTGGANHSRRTSMTYPNGKVLSFNYSTGLNDSTLESYEFLGLGTVAKRAHSQPGVDLSYIKQSGESNGDAGDQYIGLDRFGRVVDQRWRNSSADKDRFQYGYDRNSNRLWRDNTVNTAQRNGQRRMDANDGKPTATFTCSIGGDRLDLWYMGRIAIHCL